MGKLKAKQRAKLPAKSSGLPKKARSGEAEKESGNYPMPEEEHAISAKRLSGMQREEGNLTKDEFDRINRKADKILRAKSQDCRNRKAALSSRANRPLQGPRARAAAGRRGCTRH